MNQNIKMYYNCLEHMEMDATHCTKTAQRTVTKADVFHDATFGGG